MITEKLQVEFLIPRQEVTEEKYDEMLGALPPERMTSNGFLVGEPTDHLKGIPRYELYFIKDNKCYHGGLATIKDFDLWLIPATTDPTAPMTQFKRKMLSCGCCGLCFWTWENYQDQDQDAGYGICKECQGIAEKKGKEEMDEIISTVTNGFQKEENRKKFSSYTREMQEAIVFQMIEKKELVYSIGKYN